MSLDPLYLFVFLGLFSPGPNVILLTASGVRFGFRRTLPHLAGVVLGVGVIAAVTGLGTGALLAVRPGLEFALKCAAAAWILWMAWSLWSATTAKAKDTDQRPFTITEAVLFQWVNAKIWALALAASSGYAAGLTPALEAARLATAFSGANLFVCVFWTCTGSLLAHLLSTPAIWRVFMRAMAGLLALSAAMVFL